MISLKQMYKNGAKEQLNNSKILKYAKRHEFYITNEHFKNIKKILVKMQYGPQMV